MIESKTENDYSGRDLTFNYDESPNEQDYYEALTIILKVRTVPSAVTRLAVRISTILGVLMWDFPKNHTGGYPIKSFTADFRKYVDIANSNGTEQQWERLDPNNIPANVVSDILLYINLFVCLMS